MGTTILSKRVVGFAIAAICAAVIAVRAPWRRVSAQTSTSGSAVDTATKMIAEGMQTFRFETFGGEAFWGDSLKLHQAVEGSRFGGVGAGLSPRAALAVGFKVDADAMPAGRGGAVESRRHEPGRCPGRFTRIITRYRMYSIPSRSAWLSKPR